MGKNKLVLFDIDYTLFDTNTFRRQFQEILAKQIGLPIASFVPLAKEAEEETKKQHGYFDVDVFTANLIKKIQPTISPFDIKNVFSNKDLFSQNVRKDTLQTLETLRENNVAIGIFSVGEDTLQKRKIASVEKFLQKEHIHIVSDKFEKLPGIIFAKKNYTIYIVDDILDVLTFAKKIDSSVKTIWYHVREADGKNREKSDARVNNLTEIIPLVFS